MGSRSNGSRGRALDADHVFARMGGGHAAAEEQRELRSIPRRGGAAGSRTVEVVRLPPRGDAPARDRADSRPTGVRVQTWDDGFPAKPSPPGARLPVPAAPDKLEPVVHVMPAWERSGAEPDGTPQPTEPSATAPGTTRRRAPRAPKDDSGRRVADPFDATDEGANCFRCGYLVEPARARRGLMTCAKCG